MSVPDAARPVASSHVVRWLAAVLCLMVAAIHSVDRGDVPARHPGYLVVVYVGFAVVAVVAAIAVVLSAAPVWWLLTLGVARVPLVGYVVLRSVGLPGYTDEVGNWGEPVEILGLLLEATLLLAAVSALVIVGPDLEPALPESPPPAPGAFTARPVVQQGSGAAPHGKPPVARW